MQKNKLYVFWQERIYSLNLNETKKNIYIFWYVPGELLRMLVCDFVMHLLQFSDGSKYHYVILNDLVKLVEPFVGRDPSTNQHNNRQWEIIWNVGKQFQSCSENIIYFSFGQNLSRKKILLHWSIKLATQKAVNAIHLWLEAKKQAFMLNELNLLVFVCVFV